MKNRKSTMVIGKFITALLIIAFLSEPFHGDFRTAAKAATTDTSQAVSSDNAVTEVTKANSLPSDAKQEEQQELLGLPAEQPARISPGGREVNKNENPLGPNTVVLNRNYQLAYTLETSNKDTLNVYNNSIASPVISFDSAIASTTSSISNSFDAYHKKLVAVDTDGNGTQEVANIGFTGSQSAGYKLQLYISDYNQRTDAKAPVTSSLYTITTIKTYPGNDTSYNNSNPFKCTAGDIDHDGKDEIAVTFGNNVYICKAALSSFQLKTSKQFSDNIGDIDLLDSNGDGFPELLITTENEKNAAHLMIYNKVNLSDAVYNIELSLGDTAFATASADRGDIFGDGEKNIVIGGKTLGNRAALTYIKYDPETEGYDSELDKIFDMESKTSFDAVRTEYDIKCAALAVPTEGTPESVVFGGYIFNYNKDTKEFDRKSISTYYENSGRGVTGNPSNKSEDNITDTNNKKDDTYIIDTLVGNFDGNTEGKEQVIMLHRNHWYDNKMFYLTECYMENDGKITARLREVCDVKRNAYYYPAFCPVDVYNHSTKLKLLSDKSSFEYSKPVITAVLGASPYYKELEDYQDYAYTNVGTTYGTGTEDESSTSNGVTASVGLSFGFETGVDIFGLISFELEFETQVTNTFTNNWSTATSISKEISYTNYYDSDAVVLTVVPNDVYVYEATAWNDKTREYETGQIVMQVPYSPLTTVMTVEDYNKAAEKIDDAPRITADVLKHTVGDPRSYPSSSSGLTNVKGMDVLKIAKSDNDSFIGSGVGNSSIEQSITSAKVSSYSFDYELNIDVSVKEKIGSLTFGTSAGAGYTHGLSISSTKSTTRIGSVGSVPSACRQYQFKWALVVYNYDLPAGKSTQRCTVVNYICRPLGSDYPPKSPQNLVLKDQDIKSISLSWDKADGATGYNILRSATENGDYSVVGTVSGVNTNSYKDVTIEANKNYYYKLVSFNSIIAIPTEPLSVPGLYATDIKIKTQPKLTYKQYDQLDLSALVVTLTLSNEKITDINYSDFISYNITTSMENGIELDSDNSGTPITVKYNTGGISTNTNNLTIRGSSSYPIALSVNFVVGNTSNAVVLSPGKLLNANITMENTSSSDLAVTAYLVLYDEKGTMLQYSASSKTVQSGKTVSCSNQFTLPSNITGYTAKVFVWDGTNLTSSNLTPLSDVVQIPAS